MGRREYGQPCSVAVALDRVGERWALLIVRELSLGPLRFSELARAVGNAPTDVLTKRLRQLERDGIVSRQELGPPASVSVYELTPVGRELERPLLELGRWGLNFFRAADVDGLGPSVLPNSLRVVLRPAEDVSLLLSLRSGGEAFALRIADGWVDATRGDADRPDLTIEGTPRAVIATLLGVDPDAAGAEALGDDRALAQLRAMVVLPDRLRGEALADIAERSAAATA